MVLEIDQIMEGIPFLAPVIFIGVWTLVSFLIAKFGWSKLAKYFSYQNEIQSTDTLRMKSISFNFILNYNNCVKIQFNHTGIALKVLPLFPFHPRLLIPWDSIKGIQFKTTFFLPTTILVIQTPEGKIELKILSDILPYLNKYSPEISERLIKS